MNLSGAKKLMKKSHSHILGLLFGLITRLLSGSAFLMRWPAAFGRIETKGVNDLEEERSNMLTKPWARAYNITGVCFDQMPTNYIELWENTK